MARMCKLSPDKGKNLFDNAKKLFGYENAWNIVSLCTLPEFINGKSFRTDSEGFPLIEDLVNVPVIIKMIGEKNFLDGMGKNFQELDDTRENYEYLVNEANLFNNSENNKNFIAIVKPDEGKLKVEVRFRTSDNEREATEQLGTIKLNNSIASILEPISITIDDLEEAERRAGRVGVTDFTKINNIANSCVNVIRVANNYEGSRAVSEEFSHLIIGSYRDEPLIQRALNILKDEDILRAVIGDEYDDVYDFFDGDLDLIAEEALGKLLQSNLLAEASDRKYFTSNILDRLYSNIKGKFKKLDYKKIQDAINEANNITGQLAKDLLSKRMEVRRDKIMKANRTAQFNALSERIDANIDILKKIRDTETKRLKIMGNSSADDIKKQKKLITELGNVDDNIDTRITIYNYAKSALNELQIISDNLSSISESSTPSFSLLLRARSYVQSYAAFIKDMRNAINNSKRDTEVPDFLTDIELEDGTKVSMSDVINELDSMSDNITLMYSNNAQLALTEYFRKVYGSEIKFTSGKLKGTSISVEDIIEKAASDISFMDMMLDSMGDSKDPYLQVIDLIVKESNDKARTATIEDSRKTQRLFKVAEEAGITDFEWMFEKDSKGNKSGNYISKVNYSLFEEAKLKEQKRLDNRYGKNATGKDAVNKLKEYRRWLKENADPEDPTIPLDIPKYQNEEFMNLSKEKRSFYDEFMKLKLAADSKYPDKRTAPNKAIQVRKSSGNRIFNMLTNPTKLVEEVKEGIKEAFIKEEDDDSMFGTSKSGLTNFDGTEYMTLPVLYTNRLKNPNELSTDLFASLLMYQYSTNSFNEMSKVVDPIEVAKNWVLDNDRKVIKTRGDKPVKEKISAFGNKVVNTVYKGDSNIARKLNEYVESHVYQRYIKDEGDILGTNVSASKLGNWLMKASSLAALGGNILSGTANTINGLALTNIEAAAGEYFTAKELLAADRIYGGLLKEFLAELGSRNKTNKLSLFDELFNIKSNYGSNIKSNKMKGILHKLLGESIAYLGYECGDHWLYNRLAIARCKNIKVLVPKVNKAVKKVRGLSAAKETVNKIIEDSMHFTLTEDEKFYVDDRNSENNARVTTLVQSDSGEDSFKETHDDGTPNNWITPSTNIEDAADDLVRDFFDGTIVQTEDGEWHHNTLGDNLLEIYANMSKPDMYKFLEQLKSLKAYFNSNGMTVVSRNIVASGSLTINTNNGVKKINVAGTLDLLVYDKEGNFYIYDMKTHRGKVDNKKKRKWSKQLTLYKKLLEEKYGITVKGLNIIPIKVSYPTPMGETSGDLEGITEYTVKENSHQLYADGKEFKGANPRLEDTISLSPTNLRLEADDLGYNSTLLREIDKNNYTEKSLWDALEVVNTFEDRDDIKEMRVPKDTLTTDGQVLDIKKVGREIQDIAKNLFGSISEEDSNLASRVILGRAILQCRKWVKPAFNRRFQKSQLNVLTGKSYEGYYRTFGKYYTMKFFGNFMNDAIRSKIQIASNWDSLSTEERYNIKRAWTEILQYLCVYIIANYAHWPDDKNRPWALKLAEYTAKRQSHELGMLVPSLTMASEVLKTVQSPALVLSTIDDALALTRSIITPEDWMDEKKSGPYKGMSTLEANFLKAPIPYVTYYRQIEKFTGDLDTSIKFYAAP